LLEKVFIETQSNVSIILNKNNYFFGFPRR
jgi:hypothetical protein